MRQLLDEIHEGDLSDPQNDLRVWLLEALFPRILGLREVLPYFVLGNERFIGPYASFLRHGFLDRLDDAHLADFLDILSEDSRLAVPSNSRVRDFIGGAVLRGLELLKDRVPVARLYRWLGAQLDEYGFSFLEWEQKKRLVDWLNGNPEVVRALFLHWLSTMSPDDLLKGSLDFWIHRCPVSITSDLRRWLLTLVDQQQDPRVATFLVWGVARWILRWDQNPPTQEEVSEFEDLARFVGERPHLSPAYLEEISRPVDEFRFRHARMEQEGRRKWEEQRQADLESLRPRTEEIRRGIGPGALNFLAAIYFDNTEELGEKVEPRFRIERYLGPEISAAAHSGFIAVLGSSGEPDPSDIGRVRSQGQSFYIDRAVLAGIEILWAQSQEEVLALPRECLGRALVFLLDRGRSLNTDWSLAAIAQDPSVAAESLGAYWRALLDHNHEDIQGLYELAHEEYMRAVAAMVAPRLLADLPNASPRPLEHLLLAGLTRGDRGSFASLAQEKLQSPDKLGEEQLGLWLTAAFLVSPEELGPRLQMYVAQHPGRAHAMASFVHQATDLSGELLENLQVMRFLVLVFGVACPRPQGEDLNFDPSWRTSSLVSSLLSRLGADPSEEARESLLALKGDQRLSSWHVQIAHLLELHARKRRETAFSYPTVEQVVATLKKGSPANAADLQALICDRLQGPG